MSTPQQRALLRTIRYAEGTYNQNPADTSGYRTMFGGKKFDSFERHPDVVQRTPGYASAAAGAYQFLPGTWERAAKALGLKDFSPANQDRAALWLAQEVRGVDTTKLGDTLDAGTLNRLAPEWASLPTSAGKSYYGQPVKSHAELQKVYARELAAARAAGGGAANTMASAPPTAPSGRRMAAVPGTGPSPEEPGRTALRMITNMVGGPAGATLNAGSDAMAILGRLAKPVRMASPSRWMGILGR